MGNFNHVTMGTGILKIDGVDVGFLKGDISYKYNYDIEEFKTGVPRSLRGSITKEITAELSAPMAEINADNLALVLGGLSKDSTSSSEVDKTGTFTSYTAVQFGGLGTLYRVKLGPDEHQFLNVTVSGGVDAPVLKNVAETTTYTEGDDYLVDYATGWLIFNPDGTNYADLVSDSYIVKCKYKYTPPASEQLNLGVTFALRDVSVEFTHTNPTTSKEITVYMHKANASGNAEFTFAEESWLVLNPTFKAVYDSSHSENPLGYIHFET